MKIRKSNTKDPFPELISQGRALIEKYILHPIIGDKSKTFVDEKFPLRSDLFSSVQMQEHALKSAKSHKLIEGRSSEQLLKRLSENEGVLLSAHSLLMETIKEKKRIAPAGEWLLDNFYLIAEQIYTGKKHLPKGYSKELPQLASGPSQGLPRVYDIAIEIISHSDGRVDMKSLSAFLNSYQSALTLQLGELWAIPIMLRLALIENLRRLSTQIALDIHNKNLANYWADEMTDISEKDPKNLVLVLADMARSNPPMDSSFVAELTRRLQGKGSSLALPLNWIEQRLSENGSTAIELIYLENQKQAADQMSISNSIHGLRFLNNTDWRYFVEDHSIVEKILRRDINGLYAKMDFYTRDSYRHVIERIAKNSTIKEEDIATLAISLAGENHLNNSRSSHVGYYLIGRGLSVLERNSKTKLKFREKFNRFFTKFPLLTYVGFITIITFILSDVLLTKAYLEGFRDWKFFLLIVICGISISELSVSLVNWMVTLFARPHVLPRLDFSKGIPNEYRTLVVVPTLLIDFKSIDYLTESLEVRYLANNTPNLHFALLTDFKDANNEFLPGDDEISEYAKNKILELNNKYAKKENETFFLFHRPRKWNDKEKKWIGYERKRGKLSALNLLLRGKHKENFSIIVGSRAIFKEIKYIITLDTDTQLPREAAWKMIGTLSHPLNHPRYDEKKQRVLEGYTILQPRVSNSLAGSTSSKYQKTYGNQAGIDPYTHAISDVYQDLFHEASFIGKGIYDIDTFEIALQNRFPENRILSHDLLEGNYTRCGLISDVQLYEAYPTDYLTDMKRHQRWVRGDWQIARWLLPYVPSPKKPFRKNSLSALSVWKIFDNLRRSLEPIALISLLFFGWLFSPSPLFWTFTVLGIITSHSLISLLWQIARKPEGETFPQHLGYSLLAAYKNFIGHILYFIFLPYRSFINLDAIIRTNWRLFISQKKLLEWNPSDDTSRRKSKTFWGVYGIMWVEPFISLCLLFFLLNKSSIGLFLEIPILIIWMISPSIEWWISLTHSKKESGISGKQNTFLRIQARKIWLFFENFVNVSENWLPPDNYQEHPDPKIAHRTSPTNIGLSLLANLTAYDFGYVTMGKFIERTVNSLNTIETLEKYKGHLFNWYDTITLAPLYPRYISTVDSGNFCGHLIVLKQGLLKMVTDKIFCPKVFDGLSDTIEMLLERKDKRIVFEQFKNELETAGEFSLLTFEESWKLILSLEKGFDHIKESFKSDHENNSSILLVQKLGEQIFDIRSDILTMAPWLLQNPPSEKFFETLGFISSIPTLLQMSTLEYDLSPEIAKLVLIENTIEENEWLNDFMAHISHATRRARERILILQNLASQSIILSDVEYGFLYDSTQHLTTIGYNVDENRIDNSFYDLLASEARFTTFTAISQGKLPQESWFALGRQLVSKGNSSILLSWGGSMFEYLMPLLVMPTYENTLLDETYKTVVKKQIEYGKKRNIPWGVSESGYNAVDSLLNYQYQSFGIPGLGFKRGLEENVVISPYSTFLALMVEPVEACNNLEKMIQEGFDGEYGFFESIDYTPIRVPRGQDKVIIKSYMVHHQGMSLLALSYLLHDQPMQKRFEAEVQFQSSLLLLQEQIPRVTTYYSPVMHASDSSMMPDNNAIPIRVITTPHTIVPEVQLLSNGRYNVMVTNSGGGYSTWKDIAVTRWREDTTCDNWGTFCFIRDLEQDSNLFWSSAFQPSLKEGSNYEAVFSQGRAEFKRRDYSFETHTEIVVSPEDDVELRRLHIKNLSRKQKLIEVTSYAEVVLSGINDDIAHPAFNNLFVETKIFPENNSIICTRRPRSVKEQNPSMFHLMKVHRGEIKSVAYETDRSKFIGRGNTINHPEFLEKTDGLTGSQGSVLDPIISIQYKIVINPLESIAIDLLTGIGETKEVCTTLVEKYQDRFLRNRAIELSWTHSQVVLRQINAVESDAQLFSKLAGSIIFANSLLRAEQQIIIRNHRGQSGLWSYSISGDLPILLLQIGDSSNIHLVKQLVQAHAYWRLKGLIVDLVIWNEDKGGYRQILQNELQSLIAPVLGTELKDVPGGIFIRTADQISDEDRILLQTVARVVISDAFGTLEEQVNRRSKINNIIPYFTPTKFFPSIDTSVTLPEDLQFFNGYGGFSNDGKEYIILTTVNQTTPAPWINVLANPNFGSIISESGQSYTWQDNAHEFRLTPWKNDPVGDLAGEVFYLRDEESGRYWSPTPLPCRIKSPFVTKHGFGYSIFQHSEDNVHSELTVFVDIEVSVKFIILKFRNEAKRKRKLSITGYIEWVLGETRAKTQMHILTEYDLETDAMLATNPFSSEFSGRFPFFDADSKVKNFTCDRTEFIGRNGSLRNPEAMSRSTLSGRTGAAQDPCAAIQVLFDLDENEEYEIVFRLGAGKDRAEAINIIKKFKGQLIAYERLEKVKKYWNEALDIVQITTPDNALNIISNGWLNYQTLSCRIWGRSGFYQSGGAFGFRDQLQDVLSLLFSHPAIVRRQILINASRQFKEGDVQHWWHPPTGRGVRTKCSDDLLWLPFVAARYILHSGDAAILDENIYFLEGRILNAGEDSYYDLPHRSDESSILYDHCKRAINHSLNFGVNGLPFIGSGDWNDGMDKVGEQGKGESVWLAFFLYDVLIKFGEIAKIKTDYGFEEKCKSEAKQLSINIEKNAWDGEWYKRAYFDDGTPLGSVDNLECKIDSIAQSWSVLSKAVDIKRSEIAMNSANKLLVNQSGKLIQLFEPPFNKSDLNPGYIKGYVPGVRENGGQYTHAAIWLIMAFAYLKNKERTWELLNMINPVNHGNSAESIERYKVEPYVMAADIYAEPTHLGRGGWTWYTGSAGWMYQLILESFLGLTRLGDRLLIEPCIPEEWKSFCIKYRYLDTLYDISVLQNEGQFEFELWVDNDKQNNKTILLVNDGRQKSVKILIRTV